MKQSNRGIPPDAAAANMRRSAFLTPAAQRRVQRDLGRKTVTEVGITLLMHPTPVRSISGNGDDNHLDMVY